jgi:hypothetical protein
MVGGGATLLAAAVGVGAVAESIKQVPGLAYAANGAMRQFDTGIRQAASGALGAGVPAFHALGDALRPLGAEIGHVGAQQMGNVLGGATRLAGDATQALKNLEPAIGPAVNGMVSLGEAVLSGISSPAVVQGIKGVSQALSDPQNEAGITSLVSGALGVATTSRAPSVMLPG